MRTPSRQKIAVASWIAMALGLVALSHAAERKPQPPGLLFHLSSERGFVADVAGGQGEPSFESDVRIIEDGASGKGIQCGHMQTLAYRAPGNIYAQRGTLAFSWRSREPVGPTEFPIFRVAYSDHSSWDMVFLRIDYNGHGFDAFVTDIGLARTRVSVTLPSFPKSSEWTHLALSWDENQGIRFYVNGKLAASREARGVYDAGLDQFGPHSRIISPYNVQSAYNFVRGGDVDELRIYDRMLSDADVNTLASGGETGSLPPLARDLAQSQWHNEWWHRYGWDSGAPAVLADPSTAVRKVEVHDVRDMERWWWKANDGIRETTWPGVYNRSRLRGREDYFILPDWDCYSESGRSVTFTMPDEPWNDLEIAGTAWGKMTLLDDGTERVIFERLQGSHRSHHRLGTPVQGAKIRFDNAEPETPIGELSAHNVSPGEEPAGIVSLSYTVRAKVEPDNRGLASLRAFIDGRYPIDERQTVVALPEGAPANPRKLPLAPGLPLVHVLVPSDFRGGAVDTRDTDFNYTWENMTAGLDGIAIDLPALGVQPTHGDLFPLNVRVKDPTWPLRDLLDFDFSVRPGEARTLWLDTRDRILPNGKGIYLTIAGAGADFGAASLDGMRIRLIFKKREAAAPEHTEDRFTQIRDLYGHMIEERPGNRRLDLFDRFEADVNDLLRVEPNHQHGREYWYDYNREQAKPDFTQPPAPPGVPTWAFRQVEALRRLKDVVVWWIDKRQIQNGEFGGGLSDDGDLTNYWPGSAFMGSEPDKLKDSLLRELDAFYDQHMFTDGFPTIQTDELHSYEEGIQVLGQSLLLDYGSPKQLERAMETTRAVSRITGVNRAGHFHIRSTYFSGTKVATDSVWSGVKPASYLILHPTYGLVEFNGNPRGKKLVLDLADGLLAHRRKGADGRFAVDGTIKFDSDLGTPLPVGRVWHLWPVFWAAHEWSQNPRYLAPLEDGDLTMLDLVGANALDWLGLRDAWGPRLKADPAHQHLAWQVTGDKRRLEDLYGQQIEAAALREYANTEGHPWTDRVYVPTIELQRARLGGVALVRNSVYPGHTVSWRFDSPAQAERVAILLPDATRTSFTVLGYNLDEAAIHAEMTAWQIDPGRWEVTEGLDGNGDDKIDGPATRRVMDLERTNTIDVEFRPRTTTVLKFRRIRAGVPYWSRPDLGIDPEDVSLGSGVVTVRVHSLGSVPTPAAQVALVDPRGRVIATATVPTLPAPTDLLPKTASVRLIVPPGTPLVGARVVIDPQGKTTEITRRNNSSPLPRTVVAAEGHPATPLAATHTVTDLSRSQK